MISRLFLGVIDGNLETEEQLRAFLEPYSPPAPPPPVTVRRTRGSKKSGEKSKVLVEAAFDGDADEVLPLDEEEAAEEPIEDVEDEDEGDSEPPVSLPPAVKKAAPAARKSPPESQLNSPVGKPSPSTKPEAPALKAGPAVAKSAPNPALHVVAPAKQAKVHVMAKQPAKPAPTPAANRGHSSKPPNHAPSHPHSPAAKKALPMKPVPAKATAAKSVPSKSVPAKVVRGPVAKAAVKHSVPSKKTAVKAPVKVQKKPEPVKKSHPAKKPAPARKHK